MPRLVSTMVGLVIVMVGIVASLGKLVVDGVTVLVDGSEMLAVNVGFAGTVAPFSRCFSITSLRAKVICVKIIIIVIIYL